MKKLASLLVVGLCLALSQGSSVAAKCHNSTRTRVASRKLDNCPERAITVILTQELADEGDKVVRKYFGNVRIGSSSTPLRFDTTARDLWLRQGAHDCNPNDGCKRIGKGSITVFDGRRIDGDIYDDYVQLCDNAKTKRDCKSENAKIRFSHRFLSARVKGRIMGVIGLASEDSNELGGATYLQALKRQNLPAKFALYLNKNLDSDRGGELVIGCQDERRFSSGSEKYHQLVDNGWQLRLNKVELGGQDVTSSSKSAILDTGRDRMRAPRADFEKVCQILNAGENGDHWVADCEKRSESMKFTIDDNTYDIDGSSYLIQRPSGGRCQLNIEPWNKDIWSLGTSFLRSRYTIFDLDARRVGFAEPNQRK